MRYLPPIPLGDTTRLIPIRDTSVAAIAGWIVCGDGASYEVLRDALREDPGFLEWTALKAGDPAVNIDSAGRAWRDGALGYLTWGPGDPWEPDGKAVSGEFREDENREPRAPRVPPIFLPELAARLRRLEALEKRFGEVLERAKLDAMAEFAAGAGHEINNPIAVIAGRAQLFLLKETDPNRRRDLALMDVQARRVYEMIADMRLFSRPPKPEFRRFDLARLVADTLDALRSDADGRAIGLKQTGSTHPSLFADPEQIAVVLRALCKNAFESIRKNGTVEVRLDESETHVFLHVIDDGPGIPDEVRPHLFDPYFSARQAGRGLGLGLSKAWRIVVSNHDGTIEAGKTGEGKTVFQVGLPKEQSATADAAS